MVYDLNYEFSQKRAEMTQEIQARISALEDQIQRLEQQQEAVDSAAAALEQIEAVLRRMSMLAREAAAEKRRPGLLEEFEDCRQQVEALSDQAELYGFNLVRDRVFLVRAVIDALIQNLS